MKKIAITTTSFGVYDKTPLDLLQERGFEAVLNPHRRKVNKEELIELAKDAVGIIAGTEPLDADVIGHLSNLKVISRCGTGLDNIDHEAAAKQKIKVFNTPDAPSRAVAELTVGLILNLLRKVSRMHDALKQGTWEKMMGNLLAGKKAGIVGFGRIGQKVGQLLKSFDTEVAYCDIEPKTCLFMCSEKSFNEMLRWADIVSLHLSSSLACSFSFGEKEFNSMRKGSWFINVSRGTFVDEAALYNALKEEKLSGAAMDVFTQEPYEGPLRELPQVILTPHIGSYAKETRIDMEQQAVNNLLGGLQ